MMAMVRLNVPAVFMYGGPLLPGRFKGQDVTIVDVFEAVGAHAAGRMSDEDLHELECVVCPSAGACGGQFTSNTMACVSEAMGLALPGPGAGTVREPRLVRRALRPAGDGAARVESAPARDRDAPRARERRGRCGPFGRV